MKFSLMVIGLLLSLNSFATGNVLKCNLFENDQLIRSASQMVDENGEAEIDLGMHDIYSFAGFVWDGYPGTMIAWGEKSVEERVQTDSVISSTGTTLTITCTL